MGNAFVQAITNIAFTENGARTYKTTFNENLNFFALASAQRDSPELSCGLFEKAFQEASRLAVKNLFYTRDIRGGQGVRSVFYTCMRWLLDNDERAIDLLKQIPEYGCWKDLYAFYTPFSDDKISKTIEQLVADQLAKDERAMADNKPVSLCAKWFPIANNTNNADKRNIAKSLAKQFGGQAQIRKRLSALKKYLNVTERNVCMNEYEKIDYQTVPSKSMLRNTPSFRTHDSKRFTSYLDADKSGTVKINANTVYPFEIVRRYLNSNLMHAADKPDPMMEKMWKNLPDYTNGSNAICMVDVSGFSGSMTCNNNTPMAVAISLGLYFAERNNSDFKNTFITFSYNPSIETINPRHTLLQKIANMYYAAWAGNTDIDKAFRVILKEARRKKVPQCDMPKVLYIISDMEFDEAAYARPISNYDSIRDHYKKYGYELPHIVFWNVASRNTNVPIDDATNPYVTLVSGYSPIVFKYVLEGKSPIEFMHEVLESKRYAPLEEVF